MRYHSDVSGGVRALILECSIPESRFKRMILRGFATINLLRRTVISAILRDAEP